MSSTSSSPPEAGPSSTTGRQRTRNAQAQADLRVRRKAYIKTLEETVSSLEACVRQLRDQNAELVSRASSSSSTSTSSGEREELKVENARLYAMLAQAGLVTDAPVSSPSRTGAKSAVVKDNQESSWNHTSSITTKKRKVSKVQAFAKDIGGQLDGTLASTISGQQTSAAQSSASADAGASVPVQSRLDASSGNTPSSSSRESVLSLRSPSTPGFDTTSIALPDRAPKAESIDTLLFTNAQLEALWSSCPASTALETIPTAQQNLAHETMLPSHAPRADLATWLLHQHIANTNPTPATADPSWPLHQEPSSSASISCARSPAIHQFRSRRPPACLKRSSRRLFRATRGREHAPFGTGNPSLTKSFSHPLCVDDYRCFPVGQASSRRGTGECKVSSEDRVFTVDRVDRGCGNVMGFGCAKMTVRS